MNVPLESGIGNVTGEQVWAPVFFNQQMNRKETITPSMLSQHGANAVCIHTFAKQYVSC